MRIQLFNLVVLSFFLKRLCSNHPHQIVISHLNTNSIRKKVDIMKLMLMHDVLALRSQMIKVRSLLK